jgi:hypothetical protein
LASALRSSVDTLRGGMRAILAMISSISDLPMIFFCFALGAMRRAGLVDDVDRLVGQVAVVDVARRELGRGGERVRSVLDAMVRLEAALQPLQNLDGLVDRGLHHVDLLETPREGVILLEHAAVLVVGGGADALELPGGKHRLQQVGCVERAARCRARADHGVDLVDEENRVRVVHQLLQHCLEALLEVAAVLRAGEKRAHVEHVDGRLGEEVGHAALDDAPREPLGDGGFADARLADEQRVVLAATAQRLHHALELLVAADERVDLAGERERVQVLGVVVERAVGALALALLLGVLLGALALVRLRGLGDAVRDVVHHVEARDALLLQEVHRVRVLLAEDRHQHVGAGDLLLARRLDMEDGALDHALEAEGRLGVDFPVGRDAGGLLSDVLRQILAQLVHVCAAGAQHLGRGRVVQQREQQMLDRNELVAFLARFHERHVQADFEFLGNHFLAGPLYHVSSITHCKGC